MDLTSNESDTPAATGPFELIATCAFGLEAVVRRELQPLGIDATIEGSGRVHFRGDHETICQTNLWLRTADRILIRVAQFDADDFDMLFETTRNLRWNQWLPADAAFPVTGRSIQSQLSSVPACQRSVKRAIVDALRRDHGVMELAETGARYKIDVALLKDVATLTIDTTGRSLHRRGYRTEVSRAPLKETLAAALVMLSYWKPGRPLLDPFCGSGTIPIEAARIGRNLAPGLNREFAFESWQESGRGHGGEMLADLRSTAASQAIPPLDEKLIGRDIDGRVLKAARDNALRAGVADDIHFEVGDLRQATSKRRFGCLITNPPYGQRLGGDGGFRETHQDWELDALYESFPGVLRKLPTWSHYVLTAYPRFEQVVGRPADRRRKLYNGRIECTYYQFQGPKPVVEHREDGGGDSPTRVLVHAQGEAAFGTLGAKATEQAELFAARLRKRAKHLRRWPTKRGITCFRIYERDVPEIPLVVDRYENHLHITEYERPHDRDPAQHANWLDLMAQTAAQTLDVLPQRVHLKSRHGQKGKSQYEKVDQTGNTLEVNEGGLKFLVNLKDYVDTGLFLDHRETRQMVRDQAKGKRLLNLFCYTGSFSVYAAAGGAESTTSVDLSKNYLDWAWQNMRLNGFDGNQHRFVTGDVGQFVRKHQPGPHYDLVVLDPPTFSNSKRTEVDWDVQRDAVPLLSELFPLVAPQGVIFLSTNFRRFKFDASALTNCQIHEISRQTVPEDFRNRRIHRCWRINKT